MKSFQEPEERDVDGKPRDGAVRMTDAPPVGPLI